MNEGTPVYFLLESEVENCNFHFKSAKGLRIDAKNNNGVAIHLFAPEEDCKSNNLRCHATLTYLATQEQADFVEALNSRNVMLRVAENIELPYKHNGRLLIFENGEIEERYSPRRYLCPKDIVKMIEDVETKLIHSADRFINILRWRQNIDIDGRPDWSLFWKTGDGQTYPLAPLRGGPLVGVASRFRIGIRTNEEDCIALKDLCSKEEQNEPLGYLLLREAYSLAAESTRGSILTLTSALETAVKIHISKVAPDTAWLLASIQSPPIFKIMRDYIPAIHRSRGHGIEFWEKLQPQIKKVDKLVEVRNKIAHTGKIPDGAAPVKDYLTLVSDFLRIIDVLDGHEWAKAYVTPALRKALGWPSPDYKEIFVKAYMA